MKSENIRTVLVKCDYELQAALDIRRQVFVEEQDVPIELEQDGKDVECTHFLVKNRKKVLGTARLRPLNQSNVKIERMAVLAEFRRQGFGRTLLDDMLQYSRDKGYAEAVLHAQLSAYEFYNRAGFRQVGDVFYEADIPHVKMKKNLSLK